MMEWQPIETAPKDGTRILIADFNGEVFEVSWWDSWYSDESRPGWMPANLDEEYGKYIIAAEWMPLPISTRKSLNS
jgi:hypothetical protein